MSVMGKVLDWPFEMTCTRGLAGVVRARGLGSLRFFYQRDQPILDCFAELSRAQRATEIGGASFGIPYGFRYRLVD
jgi:hypothetical protein